MDVIGSTPIDAGSLPLMTLPQYQQAWAGYFYSGSQSGGFYQNTGSGTGMGGLTDPFGGLSVAVMGAGSGGAASSLSAWTLAEYAVLAIAAIVLIHFAEKL